MGKLAIVIVNYRTAALVVDCLHSLASELSAMDSAHVIVTDNDSGDDSVALLTTAVQREEWSQWVHILPLSRNGGFSFGNNAGIRFALELDSTPEYVMLLNPDTVVRSGAIRVLVDFMDAHPEAGIAGSRLENADGSPECSAHAFPSPFGELAGAARLGLLSRLLGQQMVGTEMPGRCDWVSGASMMIRRCTLEDTGLLDENYFLYFEEVDICRRAQRNGWQCWYVPDSTVLHLEGAATNIRDGARRRAGYWYDSRRRFFVKYYGIFGLVVADVLWALGRCMFLVRKLLRLGSAARAHGDPAWFAFDLLWGDLRAIAAGRTRGMRWAGGRS